MGEGPWASVHQDSPPTGSPTLSRSWLNPMKSRLSCLPCHLILRNVGLVLLTVAGTLLLTAEIHTASQPQASQTSVSKRLLALQMAININHRLLD